MLLTTSFIFADFFFLKEWPFNGLNLEVILASWKVAVWSLCTHAFVRHYKWDVLASVAASFGRERGSLNHTPAAASRLPGLLTSLCPSPPRRLYRLSWPWLESWFKKKKKADAPVDKLLKKESHCWILKPEGISSPCWFFINPRPTMNGLPRCCHRGQWSSVCLPAPHWTDRQESHKPSVYRPLIFPSSPPLWNAICFLTLKLIYWHVVLCNRTHWRLL